MTNHPSRDSLREQLHDALFGKSMDSVDDLMAAIDTYTQAARISGAIDTANIKDWTDRGLKSDNPDVWFRCLQMISDELRAQAQQEGQNN